MQPVSQSPEVHYTRKMSCLLQIFMTGNQPLPGKFAKSTDVSIGLCPCCKTDLEDHDHVLRCSAQKRTSYLALNDIPVLSLKHGLRPVRSCVKVLLISCPAPLIPCLWTLDVSRYSGRTRLLVRQALAGTKLSAAT